LEHLARVTLRVERAHPRLRRHAITLRTHLSDTSRGAAAPHPRSLISQPHRDARRSLIITALATRRPDRFSQYWLLADVDKVLEASRPNWESWGIDEAEARRLVHRYFIPSYVPAPDCPCNGECTRTGASFLSAHRIDRTQPLPMVAQKDLV
jgi:hypothetical protein